MTVITVSEYVNKHLLMRHDLIYLFSFVRLYIHTHLTSSLFVFFFI